MMKVKTKEFLDELKRWGIKVGYECGRIVLTEGNEEARNYYTAMIQKSPEFEGALVWALAQVDADVMDWIEERRAIIWVECGDDSIRTAIMCSIPH